MTTNPGTPRGAPVSPETVQSAWPPTIEQIRALLSAHRYAIADEADLQAALTLVLQGAGYSVLREVRLTPTDRIDLLVDMPPGRLGVEVKVAGRPGDVHRQLHRYADSDLVDALLLVTTRHAHRGIAAQWPVAGKPLWLFLIAGGL